MIAPAPGPAKKSLDREAEAKMIAHAKPTPDERVEASGATVVFVAAVDPRLIELRDLFCASDTATCAAPTNSRARNEKEKGQCAVVPS
jgi:hypothetical protein